MDWKYIYIIFGLSHKIVLSCIPVPNIPNGNGVETSPTTTSTTPKQSTTTVNGEICTTEGSPNPDEPCIFPFNYNGREYNECKQWKGRYWCGLQYTYDKELWGYCNEANCPPTSPTTTSTTTTSSTTTSTPNAVERGNTNLTLMDGDRGYFCDVDFNYTLDKTFQIDTDILFECSPTSKISNSKSFLEEKKFKLKTSRGVDLECSMVAIFSLDGSGSIEVAEKAVQKSLRCNASNEVCLTNDGPVFPAKCAPVFRFKGREYHGCTNEQNTDKNDRLWCATHVDVDYNAIDGHWGYCSSKCSFCAGSPLTREAQSRPCGYDCLVNTGKPMKGSVGSENVPLLSPLASLYGKQEDNFLKEVNGQIQLNRGTQIVRLICPLSKFFDTSLKQESVVYAQCGPDQYRFTVYSATGELLHTAFRNDQFGCDPCPYAYNYVSGYISSSIETAHLGTSDNVTDADECEDHCYRTKTCNTFLYSKKSKICELFSGVIFESLVYSNQDDYTICSKNNDMSIRSSDFDSRASAGLRKKDYSDIMLNQLTNGLKGLISSREYGRQRTKYRSAALDLLEVSIADKNRYEVVMRSQPLFSRVVFQKYKKDNSENILWFCGNIGEGSIYVLPTKNRLREVVYEIAHLMVRYRRPNENIKYIKVDNFLYEVLLQKENNLYDNVVGCFYSTATSTRIPDGALTESECQNIITEFNKYKIYGNNGLEYGTYKKLITDRTGNDLIMDALFKLFLGEEKGEIPSMPFHPTTKFFPKYYKNKNKETQFHAFLAEKMSVALFCETIRNIEMLPILLALFDVRYSFLPLNPFYQTFFTDIHPMTITGSFYLNSRYYETGPELVKMYGVGFFPIWTSVKKLLDPHYFDIDLTGNMNQNAKNFVGTLLDGTITIHKRAKAIYDEYQKRNVYDDFGESLIKKFFLLTTDMDDVVVPGNKMPKIRKQEKIGNLLMDKEARQKLYS